MSTELQLREQVSRFLNDWFSSTTTGGGSATTLIDSALAIESEDDFVNADRTLVHLPDGRDGVSSAETVRATALSASTLTVTPSGATIDTAVGYEVHKLFGPAAKDDAATKALDLVWPVIFTKDTHDFSLVKNQQDYSISAAGFFRDTPRQVHLVSTDDTEVTRMIYNWEMRDGKIHFFSDVNTTDTIRTFGHKKAVIGDYVEGADALVLAVHAAEWLVQTNLGSARTEDRNHLAQLLASLRDQKQGLISKYRTQPYDTVIPSRTYRGGINRNPFNAA